MLARTTIPPTHLLPYDLERSIIEHAAYADQFMALRLLGLSREVKQWIEPILYRHVKLETSSQADAFIRTLEHSKFKSPDFFANTIKSLSFTYAVTFQQAARILSICHDITSLSSWIELTQKTLNVTLDDIQTLARFVLTHSPALKHLTLTLQTVFFCPDPSFRAPVLQNLTHLNIFGASGHLQRWTWTGLDVLEHLTHFSLDIDTSTPLQAIYNLIPRFPLHLCVCLIVVSAGDGGMPLQQFLERNDEIRQLIMGEANKRLVIGTTEQDLPQDMDIWYSRGLIAVQRWDDAFGDGDAWEKAEGVVNARGQVLATAEHE